MNAVAQAIGLSPSQIKREVCAGRFPAPRVLSTCRVGWLRREIEEWAEARPVSDLLPPAIRGIGVRRLTERCSMYEFKEWLKDVQNIPRRVWSCPRRCWHAR